MGFYDTGDRINFWGSRGGFWGLFFGGLFLATPVSGPVFVVGFLAAIAISAIETAVAVRALGALGAAHYIGIPKNSVPEHETDIKADKFLVMGRGSESEVERARSPLGASGPSRIDVHPASESGRATQAAAAEVA